MHSADTEKNRLRGFGRGRIVSDAVPANSPHPVELKPRGLQLLDTTPAVAKIARDPQAKRPSSLAGMLMGKGQLAPQDVSRVQLLQESSDATFEEILLRLNLVTETQIAQAHAEICGAVCPDLATCPGDPRLVDLFDAEQALRLGALPWKRMGRRVVICVPNPDVFDQNLAHFEAVFGPVVMAIAPLGAIQTSIMKLRAPALVQRAENKVPEADSCRNMKPSFLRSVIMILTTLGLIATFPLTALALGLSVATGGLVGFSLLKIVAVYLHLRDRLQNPSTSLVPMTSKRPIVSIMVPLFNERQIATHLIKRLQALRYPVHLLDVLLVVEEEDHTTHQCLSRTRLPSWMRTVVVPRGTLKTKPRALNYALNLCRGSIIGVYDAEDAPDPNQIETVVKTFAMSAADVACLQGRLDYYTPKKNWLSRCFTLEYAAWFRIVLPGMRKLGLPVPLGGTTLFFRRAILEELGGWDAHNVTEDADLGIRLARRGYRTELLDSVTKEEPNCRAWPWVKQRSRWLKGYAMTYAVHMRHPVQLYRELGLKGFLGVQLLFGGTLAGFLFAPLLWSFGLILFGLPHPLEETFGGGLVFWLGILFLASEVVNVAVAAIAVRVAGHRGIAPWAISLQLYFPLGCLAAYKGLVEIFTKPFFWDKTEHGILPMPETLQSPQPGDHRP